MFTSLSLSLPAPPPLKRDPLKLGMKRRVVKRREERGEEAYAHTTRLKRVLEHKKEEPSPHNIFTLEFQLLLVKGLAALC